jgi:hypothetical protein
MSCKKCSDNLTPENVLEQATSLKNQPFKMHLPGIVLNNATENYEPYSVLRIAKFEGSSLKVIDNGP